MMCSVQKTPPAHKDAEGVEGFRLNFRIDSCTFLS